MHQYLALPGMRGRGWRRGRWRGRDAGEGALEAEAEAGVRQPCRSGADHPLPNPPPLAGEGRVGA
jgi:hypothetical protein